MKYFSNSTWVVSSYKTYTRTMEQTSYFGQIQAATDFLVSTKKKKRYLEKLEEQTKLNRKSNDLNVSFMFSR